MEASRENLQDRIKRGDTTVLRDIVDTLYSRTEVPAKKKTAVAPEAPPVADTASASQVYWDSILAKPTAFPPSEHTHSQYLTEETDPTVPAHVKEITEGDIARWDADPSHNALPGLQGGTTDERYHLDAAERLFALRPKGVQVAGVVGGLLGELDYVPQSIESSAVLDGITYKTRILSNGKEFFSENYRKLVSFVLDANGDPANTINFGYLYRGFHVDNFVASAVIDGWRIPSRSDWQGLATFLGGASVAGGKLKSTSAAHWNAPNTGATDILGLAFSGAGYHTPAFGFGEFKDRGVYWCSNYATSGATAAGFTKSSAAMIDGSGLSGYVSDAAIASYSIRLMRDVTPLGTPGIHVPAFRVRLFDSPTFQGDAEEFDVPAQTLTPPAEDQRWYLCARRTGPTVALEFVAQSDVYDITMSDIVPLWRLQIHGGELHQISYDNMGDGLPNKQEFAQLRTNPYRIAVEGGFAVTLGAGRSLTMTGAEVFFGHHRVSVLPFSSATDLVHDYYHVGGVWDDTEYSGGWAWPNTTYDNGTALIAMGNNKWGAVYVYRSIGDDKEIFVVRGASEANTLEAARLQPIPPTPEIIQWHCRLVGRILFQKSSDTGIFEVYSPASFLRGDSIQHNETSGLQGGSETERYHLTLAEYNALMALL